MKLGLTEYDVIVLDLMMPNLDGFALIETLAANDAPRLRRIIVTSAASPAVIRTRMHGVPFAVLPKPFNITDLIANVEQCLAAQSLQSPACDPMDPTAFG